MHRARHNFLARAGFAGDQHGRGTGRGHFHHAHHVLHGLGRAHHFADAPGFAQLALQHLQFARVPRLAQRAIQQSAQHRALQRLFDVPERARFDRRHRALFAPFAGNNNGRHVEQLIAQLFQQIQPIHSRQFHVGDDAVRLVTGKFRQGIFGRGHSQRVATPALQQLLVATPRVVFVLNNQNAVAPLRRLHPARL